MSLLWCGLFVLIGVFFVQGSWFVPPSVPHVAACWCIKRVRTHPCPSVRPGLDPRALTVNKTWVLDSIDACIGVFRVSGVHGLNVPLPLFPPYAHSYHGVYLQIMDPQLPSSSGPPDANDDRVSGTHWLNSPSPPVTPSFLSLAPNTPFFTFVLSRST